MLATQDSRTKPIFITGNENKAAYLAAHLGIELEYQKVDLDEIQSTSLEEIVRHKVRQAYNLIGKPVLVEDSALGFRDLNELPGPFIKFFVDAPDGLERLCRMCDGLTTRNATAACVYGYYDGVTMQLFRGELAGTIADHPRGDGGFGWDKIFCPVGYDGKTRAELSPDDDEKTYCIIKPFTALRDFLGKSDHA